MSTATSRRWIAAIGPLQLAIIALVVITALIHLQRGIGMSGGGPPGGGAPGGGAPGGFNIMQLLPLPMPTLFLLNGLGYLVLVIALYLPALQRYQRAIRWALIVFTAVTIILYFMVVGLRLNPIGLFDKVVEVALIGLLLIEDRRPAPARLDAVAGAR